MKLYVPIFILFSFLIQAQEPGLEIVGKIDTVNSFKPTDPLKASLYSAVLPGLGQAYNKQYWKIPIVWGAVGGGVAFILYFNKRYKTYRDAFLASLNGDPTGFPPNLTTEILATAQDGYRRDRDYAIAITTLLYAMNIIDAIVSAHLSEMKNDKDLAIHPIILTNPTQSFTYTGIGLNLKF